MGSVLASLLPGFRRDDSSTTSTELFNLGIETAVASEIERQKKRYRPENMEKIMEHTKYSRKDLQLLYRGFKEGCPNGIVNLQQFQEIFAQFFPCGDVIPYSTLVFRTFDDDGNGEINFEEFAIALSVLTHESDADKLEWVFKLYDYDNQGFVTQLQMHAVVKAMYALLGARVDSEAIWEHAQFVFHTLDIDCDGKISHEDFQRSCRQNPTVALSLQVFQTRTSHHAHGV